MVEKENGSPPVSAFNSIDGSLAIPAQEETAVLYIGEEDDFWNVQY